MHVIQLVTYQDIYNNEFPAQDPADFSKTTDHFIYNA
ncbi:hypothetical protein ALON55S_05135 [Alishewanella longhuensis]